MKLLFVHDRFGSFGGAESNVLAVAQALREKGHCVAMLHGPGTGQGEDRWRQVFQECYALDGKGDLAPTKKLALTPTVSPRRGDAPAVGGSKCEAIQSALWRFEPDVLFVHKMADLEVLQILTGCGVPTVRMVHDHDMYCMRSYKYDWLSRKICTRPASLYCVFRCGACLCRNNSGLWPIRWVSYRVKRKEIALNREFDRLVVASEYMRQELLRNGFDGERIEIHAPVPKAAETFRSGNGSLPRGEAADANGVASLPRRNLIIYSGQIIRGKGVDVLLEALSKVSAPFECIILGDGNHKSYCEQLAKELGLADRVRFAGFVPQDELRRFFAEASLAVMSSVWPEPFGASGLEAMRYGLPVVAFDAGAIKEWLIDGVNGFLVPWMDTSTFAARVDTLLADKGLARRLGENARSAVDEQYEFSKYISGLEELFGRVCTRQEVGV